MKGKSLLLSSLLVIVIATGSFAQGFHLGVKGGANIFKIDGRSFDDQFKFAYSVGAFAELNFTKHIGLQPELLWSQTNFRTGTNFGQIIPGGFENVKGSLNYLSIPILLNLSPSKIVTFQLGPQFGLLLNQPDVVDNTTGANVKQAFNKGDVSILGGVQLNLGGLKIGGRYQIGLNNLNANNSTSPDNWKNQGFQLYVGFRII
jgi:hypothetical protein